MSGEVRVDEIELDVARRGGPQAAPLRYRRGDAGALLVVHLKSAGESLDLGGLDVRLVCACPSGLLRADMAAGGHRATWVVGAPLTSDPGLLRPYVEVSRGGVLVAATDRFGVLVDDCDDLPPAEAGRYRCEVDALVEAVRAAADGLAERAASGEFDGRDGEPGRAATVRVGTVALGEGVAVENSGDEHDAVLDFTFPRVMGGGGALEPALDADIDEMFEGQGL